MARFIEVTVQETKVCINTEMVVSALELNGLCTVIDNKSVQTPVKESYEEIKAMLLK